MKGTYPGASPLQADFLDSNDGGVAIKESPSVKTCGLRCIECAVGQCALGEKRSCVGSIARERGCDCKCYFPYPFCIAIVVVYLLTMRTMQQYRN